MYDYDSNNYVLLLESVKQPSDVKRHYSTNVKLTNPGGRGTPGNSWWGCTAVFSKSWPYFRPKNVPFQTRFQTWPLKFLPCILRPGLKEIMSSLLRLEQQQKRFLKIHFELAYFSFFLSFSVEIETTTTFVHSRSSFENQLDSRPKWAKSIPIFNQNDGHKIPTLWGGTYLYGLYMGLPPPPPPPGY